MVLSDHRQHYCGFLILAGGHNKQTPFAMDANLFPVRWKSKSCVRAVRMAGFGAGTGPRSVCSRLPVSRVPWLSPASSQHQASVLWMSRAAWSAGLLRMPMRPRVRSWVACPVRQCLRHCRGGRSPGRHQRRSAGRARSSLMPGGGPPRWASLASRGRAPPSEQSTPRVVGAQLHYGSGLPFPTGTEPGIKWSMCRPQPEPHPL